MKTRPIIFSGEMVRAILDGRKTQTRRVVKGIECVGGRGEGHLPSSWGCEDPDGGWVLLDQSLPLSGFERRWPCPYGAPGDRLWVRETFWKPAKGESEEPRSVLYDADYHGFDLAADGHGRSVVKRPSIYMPRWASRITLEVTGVRVERVQEITEADARAEGCEPFVDTTPLGEHAILYQDGFAILWDSINLKRGYSWASNPWVWVVEFKVA